MTDWTGAERAELPKVD
uniref:Uncharacterized protein n=1 Tax=Arundo donax TaxID=35708 RepID=A0A0A8Z4T3_ARUDO